MAVTSEIFQRNFWPNNPTLWFLHCEIVLSEHKITDDEKFKIVAEKLPNHVKHGIRDLLDYPPLTDKYEALKSRLISEYEDDDESIKILNQSPSCILVLIKFLGFTYKVRDIKEDVLRKLWLQFLPETVRQVLALGDTLDFDTQVAIADKIVKVIGPANTEQKLVKTCKLQQEVASLTERVLQLQRMVEEKSECQLSHGCNESSALSPNTSLRKIEYKKTEPSDSSKVICRYHEQFGNKAYSCALPCNFGRLKNIEEKPKVNHIPDEIASFDFIMRIAKGVYYA